MPFHTIHFCPSNIGFIRSVLSLCLPKLSLHVIVFEKICSSDFVSSKWIQSLFDDQTARFTPLDFRATAAAQFRMLAATCKFMLSVVNETIGSFLFDQLVGTWLIPMDLFVIQAKTLIDKLYTQLEVALASSRPISFFASFLAVIGIESAMHTNAFRLLKPGTNQTQIIVNYYPLRDNASFNNVSDLSRIDDYAGNFHCLFTLFV